MPEINGDGIVGRNEYDTVFQTFDAYRKEIERLIPELEGNVLVDYPNQNKVKLINPPKLIIMDSYSVIRHKMGGTRKMKQTINPDGETWTRITRVGFGRIIFQMDLWAQNATQRGQIHAALMGLAQPLWVLNTGDDSQATMILQHYRPIRENREDEVARMIYTGYILAPELIKETLYKVKDIYVRLAIMHKKETAPELEPYSPNVHFEQLPDVDM